MASVVTEQSVAGISFEGSSSGHQFKSGESFSEWRSFEQVHYATPSTSPYWDSDDEDGGPKLCDLYGNHTWKIDNFSQLNKRELRSDHFEAGGHKWYILIYPQGCDVFNHLSLFLCVANHDKLLPGWSHYAQFTITLVNKDPKKSKDSDTLHRFWKKEHDWGWKKFMELSKVVEEFVDDDTLVIKAKVQVIRKERADRLFRCLSYEYRRELPRRFLINVEQIFRRFVEEKRGKIWKLIEDKAKWSSFCSFWLAMDQSSRCSMSRVKKDAIHKVLVKNFFIEKDVNSPLVMDSLYTGLKALEGQSTGRKRKSKHIESEDLLVPMIHMDEDVFVLVEDVLPLLERAAKEPLAPKDEKGLQNRIKDVGAGEESEKDINDNDERRLTELGRRTIEIFVLAHVFSKIEVAYQEAVALKKQEELIQEEAALLAAEEQKRRGGADNKKSKKKQGKQKRNSRKGKDKCRDEKSGHHSQGKNGQHSDVVEIKDVPSPEIALEKSDALEYLSDGSDPIDQIGEIIPPESEDTDDSEMQLPTEVSSVQNGIEGRSSSVIGDSSSTCSSDSFTAVVSKKPQNGSSRHKNEGHSASRGKSHRNTGVPDSVDWVDGETNKSFRAVTRDVRNQSETSRVDSLPHSAVSLSKDRVVNGAERHAVQKEEKPDSSLKTVTNFKVSPNPDASRKNPTPKNFAVAPPKSEPKGNAVNELSTVEKLSSDSPKQADTSPSPPNSVQTSPMLRHDNQKLATPEHSEKSVEHQPRVEKLPTQLVTLMTEQPSASSVAGLSRPLSAPITSEPRPIASSVPMLQTTHVMSRSVSFAGRFGTEPSVSSAQNYVPQSYRNAIIGGLSSSSLAANASLSYSQTPTSLASSPMMNPHNLDQIIDHSQSNPSSSFGMINHHHNVLQNAPLWRESITSDRTRNYVPVDRGSLFGDVQTFDLYNPLVTTSEDNPASDFLAGTSGRQSHVVTEEFPHLDIINELLDDDHGIGRLSMSGSTNHESFSNGLHYMDSQFIFPGEPSSGPGPLPSPGRFQRTRSYHDNDGVWRGYGAARSLYDVIPQMSPRQNRNRHSIGVLANQWQLNGTDVPYHQMNSDSSSYLTTDYQQLSLGANGYMGFRPSNGL